MPKHEHTRPERKSIERALEAVLESESFTASQQLRDFLTFIVQKSLDNQQDDIKAYTIAVDALGRDESFDPQTNAAVRVAAGRLRQTLALYNATEPPEGVEARIILEPGSYVPTFEFVDEASEPATLPEDIQDKENEDAGPPVVDGPAPNSQTSSRNRLSLRRVWPLLAVAALLVSGGIWWLVDHIDTRRIDQISQAHKPKTKADESLRPKIALTMLTPNDVYPEWFRIGEVRDSIAYAISRFDDFQFLGLTKKEEFDESDIRRPDYRVVVTVYKRGTGVRLFGQVVKQEDNSVIWSLQRFFDEPKSIEERDLPSIAGSALAPLGSPYGVIYADLLKSKSSRKKLACFTATYQYFSRKTDEGHAAARNCGEKLVAQGSKLPSVYAMLTFIYMEEFREGRNRRPRNPLVAAENMALRAIELGPRSPRAYQAAFGVAKIKRDYQLARQYAETAISLNPYDTDILGDYAAWLISVGDFAKGNQLLQRVQLLLDVHPAWLEAYRYLSKDLSNNEPAADIIAASMDPSRSPMTAASVAVSAFRTNDLKRAKTAIGVLERTLPEMLADPKSNYIKRGFTDALAEHLADKLIEVRDAFAQ